MNHLVTLNLFLVNNFAKLFSEIGETFLPKLVEENRAEFVQLLSVEVDYLVRYLQNVLHYHILE